MATGFVGRRVEVFWEQEGAWFPGVIVGRRNASAFAAAPRDAPRSSQAEHHVAYDDGDHQWHHLGEGRFRWPDAQRIDTAARNPLGGRPNSDKYRAKSTVQMTIFRHSADPASVVCYPEVWKNGYFYKAEAMQGRSALIDGAFITSQKLTCVCAPQSA